MFQLVRRCDPGSPQSFIESQGSSRSLRSVYYLAPSRRLQSPLNLVCIESVWITVTAEARGASWLVWEFQKIS